MRSTYDYAILCPSLMLTVLCTICYVLSVCLTFSWTHSQDPMWEKLEPDTNLYTLIIGLTIGAIILVVIIGARTTPVMGHSPEPLTALLGKMLSAIWRKIIIFSHHISNVKWKLERNFQNLGAI